MQNNFILPFEYLGIFKKNSPLIEDFYEIILTFISCRPDVNYQKEISFLAGILLINLEKFPAFICLLTMILSNNLIIALLSFVVCFILAFLLRRFGLFFNKTFLK